MKKFGMILAIKMLVAYGRPCSLLEYMVSGGGTARMLTGANLTPELKDQDLLM